MKNLIKRLEKRGWGKREIAKAVRSIKAAKQNKSKESLFLEKRIYLILLAVIIAANFAISVALIPLLIALKGAFLYFILAVMGIVFGLLFELVIRSIEHLEKKLVANIPENAGLRCDLLKKTFPENLELADYINFYSVLRKLSKAEYTKKEEFRRHVTMIAIIDKGEIVNVGIDVLKEYYEKTRNFITFVKKIINEEKEEH